MECLDIVLALVFKINQSKLRDFGSLFGLAKLNKKEKRKREKTILLFQAIKFAYAATLVVVAVVIPLICKTILKFKCVKRVWVTTLSLVGVSNSQTKLEKAYWRFISENIGAATSGFLHR